MRPRRPHRCWPVRAAPVRASRVAARCCRWPGRVWRLARCGPRRAGRWRRPRRSRPLGARSAGRCRGRAGCTRVGNTQSAPGRGELLLAVILAWLVAAEPRLLLGFEVLLVAAVLELLRVPRRTGSADRRAAVGLPPACPASAGLAAGGCRRAVRPDSGPSRRQIPWGLFLRHEDGWCRARRRGTYTATLLPQSCPRSASATDTGGTAAPVPRVRHSRRPQASSLGQF